MKKRAVMTIFLFCMVLFTTATAYTVPAKSRTKAAVKKVSLSAPSGSIRTVYVAKGKKVSLTTKVSVKPYTKRNINLQTERSQQYQKRVWSKAESGERQK